MQRSRKGIAEEQLLRIKLGLSNKLIAIIKEEAMK